MTNLENMRVGTTWMTFYQSRLLLELPACLPLTIWTVLNEIRNAAVTWSILLLGSDLRSQNRRAVPCMFQYVRALSLLRHVCFLLSQTRRWRMLTRNYSSVPVSNLTEWMTRQREERGLREEESVKVRSLPSSRPRQVKEVISPKPFFVLVRSRICVEFTRLSSWIYLSLHCVL